MEVKDDRSLSLTAVVDRQTSRNGGIRPFIPHTSGRKSPRESFWWVNPFETDVINPSQTAFWLPD